MAPRFRVSGDSGQLSKELRDAQRIIAVAATATIHEAGAIALAQGRANIASAGFPARWQSGLFVRYFPSNNKPSINAVAIINHSFSFADVFETGKTITGNLWLPIDRNLPPPASGRRWTPKRFAASFGKLVSIGGRGNRRPLLGGMQHGRIVPVFVGVNSVTLRKRFDIAKIVDGVRARLPELFAKHIEKG